MVNSHIIVISPRDSPLRAPQRTRASSEQTALNSPRPLGWFRSAALFLLFRRTRFAGLRRMECDDIIFSGGALCTQIRVLLDPGLSTKESHYS